jgi:hypothetical protein
VPHVSSEPEQTLPSRAALKRKAAEKRETDARRLRDEADDLDRQWTEYRAQRWPEKSA